ncbi:MAG: DUF5103 domain-containing protein [Lewinellaceae bacterium]|nr:DUF5103 domain-containing protein [Lewinellaceae bacterium]
MKILLFCCAVLFYPVLLVAQSETENSVFDEDIRTVQLQLAGSPLSLPMVDLPTRFNSLILDFDHIGDEIKDYKYTIVHCNSDWQPSELVDNQYMDGFLEDRITLVESSFNTLTQYTHYRLPLPNSNIRWSKSGNYLLKVFDADEDDELVLVRRFMVVEPIWRISAQFVRTAKVDKYNTHHEIDFLVKPKGERISNPQNDVKAFVLQNGRWDNAIGPLKPYITRGEDIVYDYQDQIVFPAGKEFRFFDMRTLDVRGERVKIITEKYDYYEVTLQRDESRFDRAAIFREDADGRFVIDNRHYNQSLLQCDYANVLFSVSRNAPLDDEDIYVFGELTDWQLKPEFKMVYNAEAQAYYCEAFLKQGYYNYQYMLVDRASGELDSEGFEGNWYETGNQYTVLVYFRPFGTRYDRLMGAATLKSGRP